jgi:glycosyltransferase involved in cell wall biosynthesis
MRIDDVRIEPGGAGGAVAGHARQLRIVHCFRAPVGGVFRHVRDLVDAQRQAGHLVGVLCDSITGGAFEDEVLAQLAPRLALGLKRIPMRRQIAPSDIAATVRLMREVRPLNPDVLHGHGAKGGAYARTIGTLLRASGVRVARIYSPHGGSLHHDAGSVAGRAYFLAERGLEWMTDALVFVSRFEAGAYTEKVGRPFRPATIVRNGLQPSEFEPVRPVAEPSDFLFIGTLRDLKGPDVFIEALDLVRQRTGMAPSAVIVGAGEDKARYQRMVEERGLSATAVFREPMPAREAFALGRTVVVPSRAESMPYIVLEAIAAGMPIITTNVGGIPEIFGSQSFRLVPPGDAAALAESMTEALASPEAVRDAAARLREQIRSRFSVDAMAGEIEAIYRSVLAPAG